MSNANPSVQEITIQGAVITIPAPYAEGTKLKANEAAAMNQLFAENVRNNQAVVVREAKAKVLGKALKDCKPDELVSVELPADELKRIQAEVETYANSYEFGVRVGGRSKDPLERRIEDIAIDFFEKALRANNLTPSKLKKDNPNAYSSALAAFIEQRRSVLEKEARAQLKKEADLASGIMEGIDFAALKTAPASASSDAPVEAEAPAAEG